MPRVIGNPLIVGLDWLKEDDAIAVIQELNRKAHAFKISGELLRGVDFIEKIRMKVGSVNLFVDLQLTGTPRFIEGAVSLYANYPDVRYITVNAASGREGIRAAVRAARISKILVGSVLSSLDITDVNFVFGTPYRAIQTHRFALMGKEAGAYGIFFSAEELEFLAHQPEIRDFCKITVGIRPLWHPDRGYHSYVLTPRAAIEQGTDYFVIGSLIASAEDPVAAAKRVLEDIKDLRVG